MQNAFSITTYPVTVDEIDAVGGTRYVHFPYYVVDLKHDIARLDFSKHFPFLYYSLFVVLQ